MTVSGPFWGMDWTIWLVPLVLIGPGLGFARRLQSPENESALRWFLDATWIGFAIAWFNVALIREAGVTPEGHASALIGVSVAWFLAGAWLGRSHGRPAGLQPAERFGVSAVMFAVFAVSFWRAGDIARPLDAYWYLDGADDWQHEALPITAADTASIRIHGSPDSGAFSVAPVDGRVVLESKADAQGAITLAVQGPLGSTVTVGTSTNQVAASMPGYAGEGMIRRYLDAGVAGIKVPVDLKTGETLDVDVTGDRLYVMTTADAVWALHAEGTLRYVHHYQLLNQVENQVWADEMLEDRWATLNQPPGWSPLLTVATVVTGTDMRAAGALFLLVIAVVGLSAVRLAQVLAPDAPKLALLVPGAMVASHGMLMLEPGSQNFPDSLYAAAILAVATAIAEGRVGWVAALGIGAGLLRWPGVVVSTIFLLTWWRFSGRTPWRALKQLWIWVGVGGVIAAVGVFAGVLEDLLFILYFETFPEHWHGEYSPTKLLPRVPGFYALWVAYTGGGLLWCVLAAWRTQASAARMATRWLLTAIGLYSLLLATIDHHPTHYFLPLVAITGVAAVTATASLQSTRLRIALPVAVLGGVLLFLTHGDVGLQPIEDMVTAIDEVLN